MKLIIILLIAKAGFSLAYPQNSTQTSILGTWQAAELENSTIEVYEAEDGYIYGKIIASDEKDWINEIVLKKVKYDTKQKAWKGLVYNLRLYFDINVALTLESDKKLKIVGSRWYMSRTFYWSR
ncbi:MAG: hypothetical protein AAF927_24570 [Bacteroidota bacterium]